MSEPAQQFVSEPLSPAPGSSDPRAMARGEPGLPRRFTWRDDEYQVIEVVKQWKSSGPCRSGADEMYLRRHWYRIITEPHQVMTVYCERQRRPGGSPKSRWFVYTVEAASTSRANNP